MNIKKLILIVVAFLAIGIVILFMLLFSIQKEQENQNVEEIKEMTEEEYREMDKEDGDYTVERNEKANVKRADYFGVQNCLQKYLEGTINEAFTFSILEIKSLQESNGIKSFAVRVLVQAMEENKVMLNSYFIVNLDDNNLTFSIEPQEEVSEMAQIELKENIGEIVPNSYNKFLYKSITDIDIIDEYINNYKTVSMIYPEYVYNKLEQEYREKRFGNIQNFKDYIEKNKTNIQKINIDKYQVDNTNPAYTKYICIDTQGRYYIIKETSIANYTILLDTYTIDLPEFISKYEQSTNEQKVLLNIQKFFEAINNSDYEYAYNKLDATYKANNFSTLAEFETYVKQNFFEQNKLTAGKAEVQEDIYLYSITISDASGQNTNRVTKTFVMQLQEGTDFVMSFSK